MTPQPAAGSPPLGRSCEVCRWAAAALVPFLRWNGAAWEEWRLCVCCAVAFAQQETERRRREEPPQPRKTAGRDQAPEGSALEAPSGPRRGPEGGGEPRGESPRPPAHHGPENAAQEVQRPGPSEGRKLQNPGSRAEPCGMRGALALAAGWTPRSAEPSALALLERFWRATGCPPCSCGRCPWPARVCSWCERECPSAGRAAVLEYGDPLAPSPWSHGICEEHLNAELAAAAAELEGEGA